MDNLDNSADDQNQSETETTTKTEAAHEEALQQYYTTLPQLEEISINPPSQNIFQGFVRFSDLDSSATTTTSPAIPPFENRQERQKFLAKKRSQKRREMNNLMQLEIARVHRSNEEIRAKIEGLFDELSTILPAERIEEVRRELNEIGRIPEDESSSVQDKEEETEEDADDASKTT